MDRVLEFILRISLIIHDNVHKLLNSRGTGVPRHLPLSAWGGAYFVPTPLPDSLDNERSQELEHQSKTVSTVVNKVILKRSPNFP